MVIPKLPGVFPAVLVSNLYPSTWLAISTVFFYTTFFYTPSPLVKLISYAVWIASAYLIFRIIEGVAIHFDIKSNHYLPEDGGRTTTMVFDKLGRGTDKPGKRGVVCFIVGSQHNHPLGVLAPGVFELGGIFSNMWTRLEKSKESRDKFGYLGRTGTLVQQSTSQGNKIFYISYWRDVEGLHAFNLSEHHVRGLTWWAENHKRSPHIGIFHETFEAPAGHWETLYHHMHPFGMGETKVATDPLRKEELRNPLVGSKRGDGMAWRLGRNPEDLSRKAGEGI